MSDSVGKYTTHPLPLLTRAHVHSPRMDITKLIATCYIRPRFQPCPQYRQQDPDGIAETPHLDPSEALWPIQTSNGYVTSSSTVTTEIDRVYRRGCGGDHGAAARKRGRGTAGAREMVISETPRHFFQSLNMHTGTRGNNKTVSREPRPNAGISPRSLRPCANTPPRAPTPANSSLNWNLSGTKSNRMYHHLLLHRPSKL